MNDLYQTVTIRTKRQYLMLSLCWLRQEINAIPLDMTSALISVTTECRRNRLQPSVAPVDLSILIHHLGRNRLQPSAAPVDLSVFIHHLGRNRLQPSAAPVDLSVFIHHLGRNRLQPSAAPVDLSVFIVTWVA